MNSADAEPRSPRRRAPLVATTRSPPASAPGPPAPRVRTPRATVPRAVWLVTAVHVLFLVTFSVLVPTFRAPDELFHVDHMRRLAGIADVAGEGVAGDDPLGGDGGPAVVAPSLLAAAASSPAYTRGAPPVDIGDAVPPGDRPTFVELAAGPAPDDPGEATEGDTPAEEAAEGEAPADDAIPDGAIPDDAIPDDAIPDDAPAEQAEPDVANPVARRPPLASWLGAAVLAAADAVLPGWPWSFDRTVALLRLVDVALVATIPLLAWASAQRFGCPPRASLTAAVAVLAVPQLTHIGSVVGDDALVVTLGAVVFLLGARVVTGDSSRRTAVLAGVACGLALLTSGSALVLVPWMVGAYFLSPRRSTVGAPSPEERRRRLGRPLIVVAISLVVGGWWHLGNLVVNRGVALGLDQGPSEGPGAGSGLASRLLGDTWGAFGWREAVLPTVAVVGATVVLVTALAVALARGRVRPVRLRLAFLLLPASALAVLAAVAAPAAVVFSDTPLRVEGRVVLVGLVGLVVVAAVGLDQLRPTPTRALPAVVFVVALGLQLVAMAAIVQRYWAGTGLGQRFRAVLAFSPWPPALVFFAAVGTLGVVAWALAELLRGWRRPSEVRLAPAGAPSA